MKAQARQKVVYVASAIAVMWAVYDFSNSPDKAQIQSPDVAQSPRQQSIAPGTPEPNEIDSLSSAPWGADPFRANTAERINFEPRSVARLSWIVSGILFNKDDPVAYVNGRMVRVGDIVDQARITAIDRKTVTLDHRGTRVIISVSKG